MSRSNIFKRFLMIGNANSSYIFRWMVVIFCSMVAKSVLMTSNVFDHNSKVKV